MLAKTASTYLVEVRQWSPDISAEPKKYNCGYTSQNVCFQSALWPTGDSTPLEAAGQAAETHRLHNGVQHGRAAGRQAWEC